MTSHHPSTLRVDLEGRVCPSDAKFRRRGEGAGNGAHAAGSTEASSVYFRREGREARAQHKAVKRAGLEQGSVTLRGTGLVGKRREGRGSRGGIVFTQHRFPRGRHAPVGNCRPLSSHLFFSLSPYSQGVIPHGLKAQTGKKLERPTQPHTPAIFPGRRGGGLRGGWRPGDQLRHGRSVLWSRREKPISTSRVEGGQAGERVDCCWCQDAEEGPRGRWGQNLNGDFAASSPQPPRELDGMDGKLNRPSSPPPSRANLLCCCVR